MQVFLTATDLRLRFFFAFLLGRTGISDVHQFIELGTLLNEGGSEAGHSAYR
jgi:hypothetical protein